VCFVKIVGGSQSETHESRFVEYGNEPGQLSGFCVSSHFLRSS
jgi:hypothetical protein